MRYNGITHKEEELLKGYIQNGITITTDIIKELNNIGISRSPAFIIKHLKRLGIYQYPDMDLVIYNRDKEQRANRVRIAESKGFTILSNDNRIKSKVKCNKCDSVISYITMVSNDCYSCKVKQKQQNDFEIRDNKNSAKIIDYTNRVTRLKEFISSDRYKEYTNWKITPVYKEYVWYRSNTNNSSEYKDTELDYSIDYINYYEYKVSNTQCPDKTNDGYKICNVCKEHKPINEFNTNTKVSNKCKECAKEYRRINILPNEIKRMRERYNNDPLFKLDSLIRAYIYGALKGKPKSKRTNDILGISYKEFRQYIEDRFEDWMSWDNHGIGEGKWALQHIIPREFAINEKEIYLINHYKNFIPMCAIENGILKNRIVSEQLTEWHNTDKGIQKIIKRNKDNIISKSELVAITPMIPREMDINRIKQSEQKLNKWFVY